MRASTLHIGALSEDTTLMLDLGFVNWCEEEEHQMGTNPFTLS